MKRRWSSWAGAVSLIAGSIALASGATAEGPLAIRAEATHIAPDEARALAGQLRERVATRSARGERLVLRLTHHQEPEDEARSPGESPAASSAGPGSSSSAGVSGPGASGAGSVHAGADPEDDVAGLSRPGNMRASQSGVRGSSAARGRAARRSRAKGERPVTGTVTRKQRRQVLERRLVEDAERLSGGGAAGGNRQPRDNDRDSRGSATAEPPLHAEPGSVDGPKSSGGSAGASGGGPAGGGQYRRGAGGGSGSGSGGGLHHGGGGRQTGGGGRR
jgi:translation initiation factor IF-2